MLQDLDKTIQGLLQSKLPSLTGGQIGFETPFDDYAPTLPAVNLFLYDVRENRDLRSNDWVAQRPSNGTVTRVPPPVRVACAYLITAWAAAIADEHLLLGQVMQALLSYPTIPLNLLQGDLANDGLALPTTALQASTLQSIGEFWQAMRGKPRAALSYTVTISVDVAAPVETPIVRQSVVQLDLGAQPGEQP
jgi:Pvc16 N-terminal domain